MQPIQIAILPHVPPWEAPAIERAKAILCDALKDVTGRECTIAGHASEAAEQPRLVIWSLAHEVDPPQTNWTDVETRLRAKCAELVARPHHLVFLCTVLRYVDRTADPEAAAARLTRIRRLNLLATELSHACGAFVIDVDRDLADVGALALQTDWRLGGPYATDWAARSIAATIASVGLDDYVAIDAQDAAKTRILAERPAAATEIAHRLEMQQGNRVAIRAKGRRQVAFVADDASPGTSATSLVKMILRGQIGLRDIVAKVRSSISRRGLGSTIKMVGGSVLQLLRKALAGQR